MLWNGGCVVYGLRTTFQEKDRKEVKRRDLGAKELRIEMTARGQPTVALAVAPHMNDRSVSTATSNAI